MSTASSTASPIKQRKLNDLRVVDLQRELRLLSVPYDKKELKGSLLEKLRQTLLNRNLDPDNYFFDASIDLKSMSSDETNRSLEDSALHETNSFETSIMEVDPKQQVNTENPVQTTSSMKSSTTTSSSVANELGDDQNDQTNRMDTNDLKQIAEEYDNNNKYLTIDQSTTKQEDENNNDKIDHGLTQVSCSSSDEELDTNNRIQLSPNKNSFNHNTESMITNTITTTTEQPLSLEHSHGEDGQQTNLFTDDNDNLLKR
ncbi:unnamed protein product [Rotaria magnacalcarata]|uniref:Uncharacterized protein n=1 Tax=Rotaria magnacalcarata TaxID=392030 RepID=A0A8S3CES9_9BILA|nr:unnamed protein product [Rotaria magnacalcarata]